ncbi:MAG: methyltransferase [Oscillospiraceae bacterium]|nr:methyltransferase [Oscillospiraceae bacterium]
MRTKTDSHYFLDDKKLPADQRDFVYWIENLRLSFTSDGGLFSHGHVDDATDLLIKTVLADIPCAFPEPPCSLLDLGCGWGAVGVTFAKLYPSMSVTMSDINPKALRFAEKNASQNGARAQFIHSDGFQRIDKTFDLIALNPPIHAGREVCRALLTDAAEHLDGSIYAVMRKKHGGLSLMEEMSKLFSVETLAREKGIFVFRACVQ